MLLFEGRSRDGEITWCFKGHATIAEFGSQ